VKSLKKAMSLFAPNLTCPAYLSSSNHKKGAFAIMAVFSRMRGNKILERLTVKDSNTPHSCDYRYNTKKLDLLHKDIMLW
jgi:hypothetical protein